MQQIRKMEQKIKTLNFKRLYLCNNFMAGDESDGWHPLVEDFVLLARKLERLGFVYHSDKVIVTEI